jgi:hypothetical protein
MDIKGINGEGIDEVKIGACPNHFSYWMPAVGHGGTNQ